MSRLSRAIGEYKRIFLEMEASPGEHTDRDESGVMHAHPRWLELYTASREVRMAMQAEATICGIEILYSCPQCKEEYSVLYGRAEE